MIRPEREYVDYLRDILAAIDKAQQFTEGMSFSTFESDDKTVFKARERWIRSERCPMWAGKW